MSTKSCGYCAGDGVDVPTAGAFQLVDRQDLGGLGDEFSQRVLQIHRRFPATRWRAERPLLIAGNDITWTLLRIYGVTCLLFTLAHKLGIPCDWATVDEVKMELGGRRASKEDQAVAAEQMGVTLPETVDEGRGDAADAVGVWKSCVRAHAPQHIARFDGALATSRGKLL